MLLAQEQKVHAIKLLTSFDDLGFHNLTGRYQAPYFVLII